MMDRVLVKQDPIFDEDFDAEQFKTVFTWWVHQNYGVFAVDGELHSSIKTVGMWTCFADSTRGQREPVGMIFGWVRGRVIQVGGMVWFPWASKRNIFECAVKFFVELGREFHVLDFAEMKDKVFFENIARHGILRKVGHMHGLYPDGPAVLFETKDLGDGS